MLPQNLTIVDVETTGGSPLLNRVIEIGGLRIAHGEVVETFETLLNPEVEIPEFITTMTGISNAMIENAPTFFDIKDTFLEFCKGNVFVAHNVNFDFSFLQHEFKRVGYGFSVDTFCTVKLSRFLFPEHAHHNLSAIIDRFNFSCERRHRALDDATVLWSFLQYVEKNFPKKIIGNAVDRVLDVSSVGNLNDL